MEIAAIIVLAIIVAGLLVVLFNLKSKSALLDGKEEAIAKQLEDSRSALADNTKKLETLRSEITELQKQNATLDARLTEERKSHDEKLDVLNQTKDALTQQFQKFMTENSEKIAEHNKKKLDSLLTPLGKSISEFKKEFSEKHVRQDVVQLLIARKACPIRSGSYRLVLQLVSEERHELGPVQPLHDVRVEGLCSERQDVRVPILGHVPELSLPGSEGITHAWGQ